MDAQKYIENSGTICPKCGGKIGIMAKQNGGLQGVMLSNGHTVIINMCAECTAIFLEETRVVGVRIMDFTQKDILDGKISEEEASDRIDAAILAMEVS